MTHIYRVVIISKLTNLNPIEGMILKNKRVQLERKTILIATSIWFINFYRKDERTMKDLNRPGLNTNFIPMVYHFIKKFIGFLKVTNLIRMLSTFI